MDLNKLYANKIIKKADSKKELEKRLLEETILRCYNHIDNALLIGEQTCWLRDIPQVHYNQLITHLKNKYSILDIISYKEDKATDYILGIELKNFITIHIRISNP